MAAIPATACDVRTGYWIVAEKTDDSYPLQATRQDIADTDTSAGGVDGSTRRERLEFRGTGGAAGHQEVAEEHGVQAEGSGRNCGNRWGRDRFVVIGECGAPSFVRKGGLADGMRGGAWE